MLTKITAFTAHTTPEGMRIAYTYSIVDSEGNLVKSNQKATVVVMDNDINSAINQINNWLLARVPQ